MKKILENSTTILFESDNGKIIGISEDYTNGGKRYYSVSVRMPPEKGVTIATRCTIEKAYQIAEKEGK